MTKSIKIMHVILSLECGGLEKLAIELGVAFTKNGFRASICCLDRLGELAPEAKAKGIKVHHVERKQGFDFTLPFRLARILQKERVDIVHTHNMSPLFYGTIAAHLAGVRVVINTRHGREKKTMSSFILGLNDAVIFISEDSKSEMLKYNHINEQNVKVIYNGIDVDRYRDHMDKNIAKDKLQIGRSTLVIGTVGRLSEEKDHFTLLDAFVKVAKLRDDVKLVIVGDGILRKELERYVKNRGLDEKVIFFGFRDDITEILPALDMFVLSSTTEGVALTLLEAMAASKPVVATNVGGNPEVVVDGETGFLVPPKDPQTMADAIMKILDNPELAKSMGRAGRKRVEQYFSLDRMVKDYTEVYEECLAKKRIGI